MTCNCIESQKISFYRGNYAEVIQGIQELAEMKRFEDIESVIGFLDHYHPQVRLETRVALIKLIPEDPLSWMKFRKDPLTRWEEVLVYNKLRSLSPEQVPVFKAYFNHKDPRVVCYSINLAARFLQYDSIGQITSLIFHKNTAISWQAVNALKLLQADVAVRDIQLLLHKTKSLKVKVECIECLAQIGDMQKLVPLFRRAIDKSKTLSSPKHFQKFLSIGTNEVLKKFPK